MDKWPIRNRSGQKKKKSDKEIKIVLVVVGSVSHPSM